jgi:hypothetical protein
MNIANYIIAGVLFLGGETLQQIDHYKRLEKEVSQDATISKLEKHECKVNVPSTANEAIAPKIEASKTLEKIRTTKRLKWSNSTTLKQPCDTVKIEIHDTVPPNCPPPIHDSTLYLHKLHSKPATHE